MYASVIVDIPNKAVSRTFEYIVPEEMLGFVKIGHRVLVPFGPRTIQGFVIELNETVTYDTSKLKMIQKTLDIEPVLTEELIKLAIHIADYYVDNYINVIETILPAALKSNYKKVLVAHDEDAEAFLETLDYRHEVKHLTRAQIQDLKPFLKDKRITEETIISQHTAPKTALAVYATDDSPDFKRAHKQEELFFEIQASSEPVLVRDLVERGYSNGLINALYNKGYVEKTQIEIERNPFKDRVYTQDAPKLLNPEQQHAFDIISKSIVRESDDVFLLHGVTGSGKTEVYLQSIQQALDLNKEAILLVPEIALTPQMVHRFKSRFGDEVAVLHSGLSHGEKFDEWRKIKDGRARVSIGARSNIFAPFKNLGIIIVDEEHESTYKQNERPHYHAIDVAKVRATTNGCPVILGSATPSIESYARAEKGVYHLLEIKKRAVNQTPVDISVIDMAEEHKRGNLSIISDSLRDKITTRIERGEQTVLLLNRRGYSNFQLCQDCGHVVTCPNCDISLTYHKMKRHLICHYCSYEEDIKQQCQACNSTSVTFRGLGTEQVEEIIRDEFQIEVVRMDFDTTKRKGMHERLLNQFEDENIPILLGTQMIAKGLDYPNVTLVGVLNADTILNLPDFRSSERTFQLLMQVAGRAGRHELSGEVIYQTYNKTHYAIEFAQRQDYAGFYESEMKFRQVARYSPYYFHVLFTVSHPLMKRVIEGSHYVHQALSRELSTRAIVIGPAPSPIERINNQYRFQILLKYKTEPTLIDMLKELDDYFFETYKADGLSLKIDINPNLIM